jgi:hypothetical protein
VVVAQILVALAQIILDQLSKDSLAERAQEHLHIPQLEAVVQVLLVAKVRVQVIPPVELGYKLRFQEHQHLINPWEHQDHLLVVDILLVVAAVLVIQMDLLQALAAKVAAVMELLLVLLQTMH